MSQIIDLMKSSPKYPYQQEVRDFVRGKSNIGLFIYYGGGKTYLTQQWIADMTMDGHLMLPALVICPKNLVFQWGSQIEQHSNFTHSIIDGHVAERREAIKRDVDFYITNYSAIRSQIRGDLNILSTKISTIVFDESTYLKSAKTLRYKLSRYFFKGIPHKAILSGKPITEEMQDLWSQIMMLDDGKRLGTSYWGFVKDHFDEDQWVPFGKLPKENAAQKLAEKISDICIYVPREKVAEQLPPRSIVPVYFEMPATTRKAYSELKKNFRLEFENGAVVDTQWAMVKSAKLHQMCQGFVYTGTVDEREVQRVETLKFDWLVDSLGEIAIQGPVLLWGYHRQTVEDLCDIVSGLKMRFSRYMGGDDQSGVNLFLEGHTDILVLSTSAAFGGFNFQRAASAVFFSQGYSGDMRDNALGRNYRLGSEIHQKVMVYDLLTKNSVDEVVYQALEAKADVSDAVLKHLIQE